MSKILKATFTAQCQQPTTGSKGIAYAAHGFDDPESAEYGAYLFQPDGDENAYYCDPERDLILED